MRNSKQSDVLRLNIVEFTHKMMWYHSLEQHISKKNNTILAFEKNVDPPPPTIYFQLIIIFFVCLFHLRIECILLKFHWDMKVLTEVHFQ